MSCHEASENVNAVNVLNESPKYIMGVKNASGIREAGPISRDFSKKAATPVATNAEEAYS
jgi:hypothetical protein